MRFPRPSIAALCVVTALISVDFAVLRWTIVIRESGLTVRGILFMLNVLGFAVYQLFKVRAWQAPFLIGFVAAGLLAALIYFDFCQLLDETATRTQQWMLRPISPIVEVDHLDYMYFPCLGPGRLVTSRSVIYWMIMTPLVRQYTVPQLLLAIFGGVVARRLMARDLRKATMRDRGPATFVDHSTAKLQGAQ